MLTDAEKKWAERQRKKHFSRLSFFSREDFSAPWFGSYSAKKIEALKKAIRNAKESRGWKIVPDENSPFEICASESADWHVAKVQNHNVASFLCAVEPNEIAALLRYLEDYRDAAEFEARVAAKLARGEFHRPCHSVDTEECAYPVEGNCCVCHLKYAQLAVEEEMDK